MQVTTPFNYYLFDREIEVDNLRFFAFEPALRLKYEVNNNIKFLTTSRLEREFGSLRSYFPNTIIINYRELERYNRKFQNNSVLKSKVSLQYENIFNSLFGSLSYSYSINNSNLIYADDYFTNGGLITSTSFNSNNNIKHNISSRISKRFTRMWLISLNGHCFTNTFQRQVNNQMLDIENKSKELIIETNFNPNPSMDVNFYLRNSFNKSFVFSQLNRKVTQLSYKTDVSYSRNHHQINIKGEYFNTYPQIVHSIFFVDVSWKYDLNKQAFIMIVLDNILDRSVYQTSTTDGFTALGNSFELRPFQVYLTTTFTL